MKKIFTLLVAVLLTANVLAQAPQFMSYQAVIRNSSNALVTSTQVGMKISILQTISTGAAVYVETQTPTTNANGLLSLAVGSGTATTGTFANIDWSAGPYFIKTETDPTGGTDYSIIGTSQLMSVPYALYAAKSGTSDGSNFVNLTTNLATEATTRAAADVVLTDDLATEVTRATNAEGVLTTNLAIEVTDRTNADLLKEDKSNKSVSITTDGTSDTKYPSVKLVKDYVDGKINTSETATQTALDLKANLASPTFTGTVSGIDKSMVGLSNVDNTTDANKPVSIATQTALDLKANLASPTLTGVPIAPTADPGTNTTQIATTEFVQAQLLNTSEVSTSISQGAIWITPTTGTLNGIAFTLTNSNADSLTDWDLSNSDFSVAPLSVTQTLTDYSTTDSWTITFASPISNLKLYCKYWRTGDYTFDNSFSILSGSGLSSSGNILTVSGTWGNGIVEFAGPITTLSVTGTTSSGGMQIMTFGNAVFTPILGGTGIVTRVDSPALTGTPTAPTAPSGTNTNQLATTAFVAAAASSSNFVDLTTDQTIAGAKTFSSDVTINGTSFGTNGQPGSIGIGINAGSNTQGSNTVAIGNETGINAQGSNAVAIGAYTAGITQGSNAVAVGYSAAYTNQGSSAVAIGNETGSINQGPNAIAIGSGTGYNTQGTYALAVGASAGNTNQGPYAIAMGINSGNNSQGMNAVAIGESAGYVTQGSNAVAIGLKAGEDNQGSNAIAIGQYAGRTNQHSNSIVLNASGNELSSGNSGFFVSPINGNGVSIQPLLIYNTTTSEISYDTNKTFVINHPTKPDSYLVHACLEGPEAGVYYRGESKIENNQSITVKLPDYVSAFASNFSIQITAIYEDDSDENIVYRTSRVKDNSFTVHGKNGSFYWIVYGQRGKVEVEPKKAAVEVGGDGPYKYIKAKK